MDRATIHRPEREDEDTHPHICCDGLVYMTYTAFGEEIGDEVERLDVIPCRRCEEEAAAKAVAETLSNRSNS
jgi:hypothetical protein